MSDFSITPDHVLMGYNGTDSTVEIPEGVKKIGSLGSSENSQIITRISIPSSVSEFMYFSINSEYGSPSCYPFSACENLTEISVAEENAKFSSVDGILYTKARGTLLVCPKRKKGKVTIPASVKKIYRYAFYGCRNLTAFEVEEGSGSYCAVDGILYNKKQTEIMAVPTLKAGKAVLPEGITEISCSFEGCSALTEIILPEKLTKFHYGVPCFKGCSSLKRMVIPKNIISIGEELFSGCTSLSEITLPDNLRTICKSAFQDCTSLREITLPPQVMVDAFAFKGCTGLTTVIIQGDPGRIRSSAFQGCKSISKVTVDPKYISTAQKLFKKAAFFAPDGTPFEPDKKQALKTDDLSPELLEKISKHVKLEKLLEWADVRKKMYSQKALGIVRMADTGEPAPHTAVLFVLYAYENQMKKEPVYHKATYKTDYVELSFVPEADEIARTMDHDSLMQAIIKTDPCIAVLKRQSVRTIPLIPDAYVDLPPKDDVLGIGPSCRFVPYARFASPAQIEALTKTAENLMKNWSMEGRRTAIGIRSALLLSDTKEAAAYLDKYGMLDVYAKMRGMTAEAIRSENSSTVLDDDGSMHFDL
ncbi:MAG: leucine-rich repeat domain-containing protein [Clostridiales bacterium]|nr:leucine-rich repeat domain-containing protein [Clostridiales bacterium]